MGDVARKRNSERRGISDCPDVIPDFFPRDGLTLVCGSKVYENSADRRKLYANAIGLDMLEGEGVDVVADLEQPIKIGPFAHVDCHSVLEHVKRPWLAAPNIQDAMIPEGTIYFSVPFIWRRHGYPNDYYRYTADAVRVLFDRIEWQWLGYTNLIDYFSEKSPPRDKSHRLLVPRCEVVGFGVKI